MEECSACHRLFRRRGGLQLHMYNSPSCYVLVNKNDVEAEYNDELNQFESSNTDQSQRNLSSCGTNNTQMDVDAPNEMEHDADHVLCNNVVAQDIPTELLEQHNDRNEQMNYMVKSLQDTAEIELLRLLRSINAPLYAFDHINNWAGRQNARGYTFPPNARSRETVFASYMDKFDLHGVTPQEEELVLHDNRTTTVVTFDFQQMMLSLLSDKDLMHSDNLALPNGDVCNVPNPYDEHIDEFTSGSFYHTGHATYCFGDNDFLCPLVFFIDKTHPDEGGKLKLEPVIFTLAILKRSVRNTKRAWRPLGIVSNLGIRSSSETDSITTPNKLSDYHNVLRIVFRSLCDSQARGEFVYSMHSPSKGIVELVFKTPILCIMGDADGNEDLCGMRGRSKRQRPTRECLCSFEHCDNPLIPCEFIEQHNVAQLIRAQDHDELHRLGQHVVHNAFFDIQFCHQGYGVFGATPPEPLHSI